MLIFEPEQNPFNVLYVDVTHRCQMACANCYLPNRELPDMDLVRFKDLIEKLPAKVDLRLIGGEPTLRADLARIIKLVSDYGHRPMLITNGLKLSDFNYCKSLKEAGLKYAQISLNGYNDDDIYNIIDKMRCSRQKLSAVENCEKLEIGVSISAIIIKGLNLHLIKEIIEFSKTLKKPARVNFRNVGQIGRSMISKIENLTFSEIVTEISNVIGIEKNELLKFMTSKHQLRYPLKTGSKRSEVIWIKVTDWENYPTKIIDVDTIKNFAIKGRVTQDFQLAPFFEHVKENEFGF